MNEMSFLLPHLLKDGRGRLEVYFTRVYNPVWTNPDGFSWIEALTDESKVGLHVALTPTWSETAVFADYVLPMGVGSERHDIHSYETARRAVARLPPARAPRGARARLGQPVTDTREVNPGEVWEENEFWIELSWRIDPDGALGIRKYFESRQEPGKKLTVDEYYALASSSTRCRACRRRRRPRASRRSSTCAATARSRSAARSGAQHEAAVPEAELAGRPRVLAAAACTPARRSRRRRTSCRSPSPGPGRRGPSAGRRRGGRRGPARLPDPERPARVLLLDAAALGLARARPARLHPEPRPPGRTSSPARCRSSRPSACRSRSTPGAPTRSGSTRSRTRTRCGCTRRTRRRWGSRPAIWCGSRPRIGHFVVKAWVTEGIRPGVVACSHHMGRWKTGDGTGSAR